jgi:amino acid transporter
MTNAATVALSVRPAQSMGVTSVAAIGIGAMVGAGIFALIGQAALVAGQQVWISFLLGGVIALLSGYSFAKLSTR